MKKSTILKIAILLSCLFFYQNSFTREYEIQFKKVDFKGKLDYLLLKKAGIDKFIIRVFEDDPVSGGLFFENSVFRVKKSILDRIIPDFNFNKLNLWTWMITRKFSWIQDIHLYDMEYKDRERRLIRKLDLFNPDAIKKIISVYKELALKKINGILIQDDLFIRHNEGFSNWGKAKFSEVMGLPFKKSLIMNRDTEYNSNWIQLKVNQVNKVLSLIVKECKRVNPRIKIGINVYYETPVFVNRSEIWYAHNLRGIINTGIDFVYLMSYHRQIKKEMKLSENGNRMLFKKIVENAYEICKERLIVKIQVRDWDTREIIPLLELRNYIRLIPKSIKKICFTPVEMEDFYYIKSIIKSDNG